MKAHQDIEQQLAQAQDAWEAAPAPELWDRLEQRLDAQAPAPGPRRPRRWLFRVVSVALLAVAGLGLWWALPEGKAAAPKGKAFAAHDIAIAIAAPIAAADPAAAATEPANRLSFGDNIGIGNTDKGLLSKPLLSANGSPALLPERSSIFSMNGAGRLLMSGSSPASPTYNGNTQVTALSTANPFAINPELSNYGMIVSNSSGNPIDTVGSLQQFRTLAPIQENAYLQLNVASNQMNFNYVNPRRAEENRQDLQHLKWLLGSWKTQGASAGTMEEWRQKDDFTMLGRGYFVVNGDTIVTEEMRIEQRGPNVYFILVKDQNQHAMKFRLRSSQPNELIFKNDSPKSDEELVLRGRPGSDEMERILQNQSEDPPTKSKLQQPREVRVMRRNERP